ncbi:MAG: DUF2569 family protein [Nanoarchaeota archaeon]
MEKRASSEKKIIGLGGFLIFFQVTYWIGFFSGVWIISTKIHDPSRVSGLLLSQSIASLLISSYLIYLFYSCSKKFKIVAIAVIWISFFSYLWGLIPSLTAPLPGVDLDTILPLIFGYIGMPLAGAVIFTLYLINSERVKNTFVKR